MHSPLLLFLLSAAPPLLTFAQSSDSGSASSARAAIISALKAGHSAVTSIASAAATAPLATSISDYIATAIPSRKFAQQTNNFRPIDYPLVTELPSGPLRSFEASVIAEESSAYRGEVSSVLNQYESLFSEEGQGLSSSLYVTETALVGGSSFSTITTTTTASSAAASSPSSSSASASAATATATATSTSKSAAGATAAPGGVLGFGAGVVAGALGVIVAL